MKKKRKQESVSSVAADPDNLQENSKEAGREMQGTQGLRNNCTSNIRNCTRVVDAMWEMGETWVEIENNVDKRKGWFSSCRPRQSI